MTVSPRSLALDILERADITYEPRICEWCDAQFWPTAYNPRQVYCSARCRTKMQHVRISEERAAKRRDSTCDYCGETFTPSIYKPDAKFCGATCRQKNRRQKLAAEAKAQPKPKATKRGTEFTLRPKPAKEQRAAITPPESKVKYPKGTFTDEQMFAELERIGRELERRRIQA